MLHTIRRNPASAAASVETVSGVCEPKQYLAKRRSLLCADFKDFKRCLIASHTGQDRIALLHRLLSSVFLCYKPERLLGTQCCQGVMFERTKDHHWDSTAQLSLSFHFFLSSEKHPDCHSFILTQGKATFLSRICQGGKVLFRNSQEENTRYSFKTDRTQTLACAIKKTQLSSPSPAVILSVSHFQGLLALPNFSSSPSSTLSHFPLQKVLYVISLP